MTVRSEEVAWDVDGIAVRGTLTRPDGEGPFPGVVFVAGSGPTDRDWCSPLLQGTACSGRLLADALTREGFMTLRYDKRASGPHAAENARRMAGRISMQAHLDELAGGVEALLSDAAMDPARVFALTSSEGAIHALNYQLEAEWRFAGLVLTGAPGRAIGDVARDQILAQVQGLPNGTVLMEHYDAAIAAFEAGRPVHVDPVLPEGMRMMLGGLATPINLPFARELWTANPAGLLARVREPVLVVIGRKDVQVDWEVDGRALEAAAGGNVEFAYPADADHVLKHEDRPREDLDASATARYNSEGRVLDAAALTVVTSWLSDHARRGVPVGASGRGA
jgi:pimeloyl-ACP methyl ester carboxylesterase